MVQKETNEREEIYEINNKKYKVINKCVENGQSADKIYDILCKYAISKLSNSNVEHHKKNKITNW